MPRNLRRPADLSLCNWAVTKSFDMRRAQSLHFPWYASVIFQSGVQFSCSLFFISVHGLCTIIIRGNYLSDCWQFNALLRQASFLRLTILLPFRHSLNLLRASALLEDFHLKSKLDERLSRRRWDDRIIKILQNIKQFWMVYFSVQLCITELFLGVGDIQFQDVNYLAIDVYLQIFITMTAVFLQS